MSGVVGGRPPEISFFGRVFLAGSFLTGSFLATGLRFGLSSMISDMKSGSSFSCSLT